MKTTAEKVGDNILNERTVDKISDTEDWYRTSTLVNNFNFLSKQRTTTVEMLLWNKKSDVTSTSTSIAIQNFSDIEGKEEIARAHAKLVELKGKPPALEDVLKDIGKKTLKIPGAAT